MECILYIKRAHEEEVCRGEVFNLVKKASTSVRGYPEEDLLNLLGQLEEETRRAHLGIWDRCYTQKAKVQPK